MSNTQIQFDRNTLRLSGSCDLQHLSTLQASYAHHQNNLINQVDLTQLTHLDTAGAFWIDTLIAQHCSDAQAASWQSLPTPLRAFCEQVLKTPVTPPQVTVEPDGYCTALGKKTLARLQSFLSYCHLLGALVFISLNLLKKPRHFSWKTLVTVIYHAGYQAIPIIAIMSFLIGVVLAYQLSSQLAAYGASIFVVDVTSLGILREFSPLITAILIAGRTSTAFTAEIGMMQLNEEVDALTVMGVHPIERLVLPRVLAVLISLPLLTLCSIAAALLGSMLVAKLLLHLPFTTFLLRFQSVISLNHLFLGLIKTPFFAFVISSIGCFYGIIIEGNPNEIGNQTMRSAVTSIFMIIVVDALFSVLLTLME